MQIQKKKRKKENIYIFLNELFLAPLCYLNSKTLARANNQIILSQTHCNPRIRDLGGNLGKYLMMIYYNSLCFKMYKLRLRDIGTWPWSHRY